jgi:hypothetical protein
VFVDWDVDLSLSRIGEGRLSSFICSGSDFIFYHGPSCPFKVFFFLIVVCASPTSENSRHSLSPSSDILVQAVIVASWGRRAELPVALRGCGAWEEEGLGCGPALGTGK